MLPRISVITVVFNAKDDIELTIRNVLDIDYPNLEYVIVDGGSTDGTKGIIAKYANRRDHYISEVDDGLYDAMNKGTNVATGQWLNFMNAGDKFHNSLDFSQLNLNLFSDKAIVYGNTYRRKTEKITKAHDESHVEKFGHVMTCHQSMFFNKELVREELSYDSSLDFSGDSELVTRLYLLKYKFQYLNMTIGDFKGDGLASGGNIPFEKKLKARIDYFKYIKRHLGLTRALKLTLNYFVKIS